MQATGIKLGMMIQNVANMGTALVISFIYGWQLTLLIIGFLPFIIAGGYMQIRIMAGVAGSNKTALEEAGKVFLLIWWPWPCMLTMFHVTHNHMHEHLHKCVLSNVFDHAVNM